MNSDIIELVEELKPKVMRSPEVKVKTITTSVGKLWIALNPNWLEQWGISPFQRTKVDDGNGGGEIKKVAIPKKERDSILYWIDENNYEESCLLAMPWRKDLENALKKKIPADLWSCNRPRVMGRSAYIELKDSMIEVLDVEPSDSVSVYSDGLLGALTHNGKSKREAHDIVHRIVMNPEEGGL